MYICLLAFYVRLVITAVSYLVPTANFWPAYDLQVQIQNFLLSHLNWISCMQHFSGAFLMACYANLSRCLKFLSCFLCLVSTSVSEFNPNHESIERRGCSLNIRRKQRWVSGAIMQRSYMHAPAMGRVLLVSSMVPIWKRIWLNLST